MEPTTTPRPVMDIRPQRPAAPQALPSSANVAITAANPTSGQQIAPTPSPAMPLIPEDHHEVQPTPTEFPAKLPKSKTPVAAILIAILVGACLVGLTIFGYLKTQDKKAVVAPATATTEAVTTGEIEGSITSTDAALEALEAAGFNPADLSDDSLGL